MTVSGPGVRAEQVPLGRGPAMGAFAAALRTGEGPALDFLEALPSDGAAWERLMHAARAGAHGLPAGYGDVLTARQRALGTGPRAEEHAALLAGEAPVLAVVTGQQPGLLGGPLLTFHKVAGAIALARRLDGVAGIRVVPVFWLASEDHDWDEANRALVIDRRGQPAALQLEGEADGRSLMDVDVPEEASDRLLEELRERLPDTDRGRAACELAVRAPDEPFATWCARCLVRVFGDAGLVVVEPDRLLPHVGSALATLVREGAQIMDAVRVSGRALRRAGLPGPLDPEDGKLPVFVRAQSGGPRLRASERDGRVLFREAPTDLDVEGLARLLEDHPLRGSGNVVGRVFVQNQSLPVLAYVAGPTEIAYHAQLRAAHEAVGRWFPQPVPRPEATWIDRKGGETLEAFGLDVAAMLGGASPSVEASDAEAEIAAFEAWLAGAPDAAAPLTARGGQGGAAVRRALDRLRAAWEKAAPGVRAAFQADEGVGRARWQRAVDLLVPRGRPQERLLSPLSLIARHGVEPVRQGLTLLDPLPAAHTVLHLEDA